MSACSIPCGGRCCRDFPMSASYEEMEQDFALASEGKDHRFSDITVVVPMLIRLGPKELLNGMTEERYTCRHLTAEGKCGIYDQRPRMCRDYPYRTRCQHCGAVNETEFIDPKADAEVIERDDTVIWKPKEAPAP